MNLKLVSVEPLPNCQLALCFSNGEKRIFDVKPYLEHGIFKELRRPEIFNTVRVVFDTVEWSNGADICPETLYADSVPMESNLAHAI